jgi:hypothetical protein
MHDGANVLGHGAHKEPRYLRLRIASLGKFLLAGLTVLMLMGMGEQFFAAPVLFPALWWASRSSGTWGAALFVFLAALLMAEIGWVVAYLIIREQQPWIVLGPVLGFSATIAFFIVTRRRTLRSREARR